MIYFFADDHYGTHAGRCLYGQLPMELRRRVVFTENDWDLLESERWVDDCELLILHCIAGTCGQPLPGDGAETAVKVYLARGGNVLLLHGSSAAFWHWPWWRRIVGLRWVRENDPDGATPSTHPHSPCRVETVPSEHPLSKALKPFDLEEDEVYINLQEEGPVTLLMTAEVDGKTYPQCFEAQSASGSRIVSFLPGHLEANVRKPTLVANVAMLVGDLVGPEPRDVRPDAGLGTWDLGRGTLTF